jgi:protein-S-isoprenylcysteine O-methyltransferase Ste14
MTTESDKRGPGVRFPPPLIFLCAIAAGYLIQRSSPLAIGDADVILFAGWATVIITLTIILLAALSFRRAKTSIEPWHPTSSIISAGLYRYSRNPIYLAFCVANIGTGLILNSWWIVASFIPAVILVYLLAIKREEAYLEAKFGEEYLAYKSRVRRWF